MGGGKLRWEAGGWGESEEGSLNPGGDPVSTPLLSLSPRPGEPDVVAGLVPTEPPAPTSHPQVYGGGGAAAGAVPAGAARLPTPLLGPGCSCHLAHQHHPRPHPLFQVSAPPSLRFSFLCPSLPAPRAGWGSRSPSYLPAVPPPLSGTFSDLGGCLSGLISPPTDFWKTIACIY